ncbi:hypothetical protein [Usitatibacter palustris]|uniref:hypothetical protein n=1 Tax=Usitatibacter palustris TaxID=2732487 RepID=UPI00148830CE|nr:hypothetical protein [Usitatibacter palustris]
MALVLAVALITIGYLPSLWPLPSTIAADAIREVGTHAPGLSAEATERLLAQTAHSLWTWWAIHLVIFVVGVAVVWIYVRRKLISLRATMAFFFIGILATWAAVLAGGAGPIEFVRFHVGLIGKFMDDGNFRELVVVTHRIVAGVAFHLGLLVLAACRLERRRSH